MKTEVHALGLHSKFYFMRAAARQRQHRENGLSRQAETECKRTPFYFRF